MALILTKRNRTTSFTDTTSTNTCTQCNFRCCTKNSKQSSDDAITSPRHRCSRRSRSCTSKHPLPARNTSMLLSSRGSSLGYINMYVYVFLIHVLLTATTSVDNFAFVNGFMNNHAQNQNHPTFVTRSAQVTRKSCRLKSTSHILRRGVKSYGTSRPSSMHRLTSLTEKTSLAAEESGSTLSDMNGIGTDTDPQNDSHVPTPLDLNIVLLDNYDSYTYNLYQYLASMCVNPPLVIANDAYSSWDELKTSVGLDYQIDAVVISPGPGTPANEADVGICREVVERNPSLPILGVCLGHQLLGLHYGADVELAPGGPVHGMQSPVSYLEEDQKSSENDDGGKDEELKSRNLFESIEQGFHVVRYHSLTVQFPDEVESLDIEPIAWCDAVPPQLSVKEESATLTRSGKTKVCMALRHKTNPHYGVQFHPESIGTGEAGYQIMRNFCDFVAERKRSQRDIDRSDVDESLLSQQKPTTQNRSSSKNTKARPLLVDENKGNGEEKASKHTVHIHQLSPTNGSVNPSPEIVFESLFASSESSFWLDSSTGPTSSNDSFKESACPIRSNSRFSIMGNGDGPLSKRLEYYGEDHIAGKRGLRICSHREDDCEEHLVDEDILGYLRKSLTDRGVSASTRMVEFDSNSGDGGYTFHDVNEFPSGDDTMSSSSASFSLPFEYRGGYVGYLGYEVRHDSRKFLCEQELCNVDGVSISSSLHAAKSDKNIPTSAFLFTDRSLVYDHFTSDWYLVGVSSNEAYAASSGGVVSTVEWMQQMSSKLQSLRADKLKNGRNIPTESRNVDVAFELDRTKSQYEADIKRCHEEIRNGESYELCLTNQLRSTVTLNRKTGPFDLYKVLRQRNPAPFAAFLNFGGSAATTTTQSPGGSASVSICCSSPERFLSVTKLDMSLSSTSSTPPMVDNTRNDDETSHGWDFAPPTLSDNMRAGGRKYQVESKPIKGTTARPTVTSSSKNTPAVQAEDARAAEELRLDVKNRAENLMIVDLLRNDLSRVCEVGSVHVPRLMHIESYATVHQLVSTIRGIIDSDKSNAVDVISACFPGGSMTGAPKLRSVDLLDEMEEGVSRGPYSGCLGYISLNGSMDMNIIIRTAIVTPAADDVDYNEKVKEDATDGEENESTGNSKSWNVSIGCGGAITALSESEDEYNEMLLKARAVREAVEEWAASGSLGS